LRISLLKKIVVDFLKIPKQNFYNKTILDLACGTGAAALSYTSLGAEFTKFQLNLM